MSINFIGKETFFYTVIVKKKKGVGGGGGNQKVYISLINFQKLWGIWFEILWSRWGKQ